MSFLVLISDIVNNKGDANVSLDNIAGGFVAGAREFLLTGEDLGDFKKIKVDDFDKTADEIDVVVDLSTFSSDFELDLKDERVADTLTLKGADEIVVSNNGTRTVTFTGADGATHVVTIKATVASVEVARDGGVEIGPGVGLDNIEGGDGADTISGGAGHDTIAGGAGNDNIISGVDATDLGGSGERSYDFPLIRLGQAADVDVNEYDGRSENAEDLLGTYGGDGEPLSGSIVFAVSNDLNQDDNLDDNDNGKTAETFTINGEELALDSVQVYNAQVEFVDGTTGNFTAVVIQLENGEFFLAPEPMQNADSALLISGEIKSITLENLIVDDTNLYGLRLDMAYAVGDDDSVNGGSGDDTIQAGVGDDFVEGGIGGDHVFGGAGADQLYGGSGDDVLEGGSGEDYLKVGSGNDAAYGGAGDDTLQNASGDDLLFGGSGDDSLVANFGDDSLFGGSGADTLIGGSGDDSLVGGSGDDFLLGVDFGDITDTGSNTIYGGGGADVIAGGTLGDSLFGGTGNDRIEGRDGGDTIFGGAGADLIVGYDATSINGSNPGVLRDDGAADVIDGGSGDDTIVGGGGSDTLDGGSGNDVLSGGTGADVLEGGSGDDSLSGGSGDDTILGGGGSDSVDGGGGLDFIDYSASSAGVVVDLTSSGAQSGGDAQDDTLLGVDGVIGSSSADTILGYDGEVAGPGGYTNVIYGGAGGDSLDGRGGSDTVYGGSGDDTVSGGFGADTLYGGQGVDTIYSSSGDDLTYAGSGDDTVFGNGGADTIFGGTGHDFVNSGSGDDTIYSGSGDDFVFGSSGDDNIFGGQGADAAYGGAGGDSLSGGIGADTLFGGSGDDSLEGGSGDDFLTVGSGQDTAFGGVGDDTILNSSGDDSLVGGSGDDSIVATAGADTLEGGAGDDTLIGGSGDDSLVGGSGDDELSGGGGNDSIDFGAGADTVFGGSGDDTIDGVNGTAGNAPNLIFGGDGADLVFTGRGDDTLFGGAGADTLNGETGDDFIDGGSGDDRFTGGDGNDSIVGRDGADTIDAEDGNDTLDGGVGNDSLTGGEGFDIFVIGSGDDTISDFGTATGAVLNDGDQTNNDFVDLSAFYDNISEVRADFEDDGILNQSNALDDKGRAVDYSDNSAMSGGTTFQSVASSDEFTQDTTNVVCFAAGTKILTPSGETKVEDLALGDPVETWDNGAQPLLWIGSQDAQLSVLDAGLVRIRQGALGPGVPARDLIVSPQHRIFISGPIVSRMIGTPEALTPAKALMGLPGVEVTSAEGLKIFHLFLARHELLIADGALAESFFPGEFALRSLSENERRSLIDALPEVDDGNSDYAPVRRLIRVQKGKQLAGRAIKNSQPLQRDLSATSPDYGLFKLRLAQELKKQVPERSSTRVPTQ